MHKENLIYRRTYTNTDLYTRYWGTNMQMVYKSWYNLEELIHQKSL